MFNRILNRLEAKITHISGLDYTPGILSFERALVVLSHIYLMGIRLRALAFDLGIFQQKKLPCRVICIGNIVAGGAGKTPMTIYLARLLKDFGKKVVVISRGYRGKTREAASIVGDGQKVFMDADQAGDEPYMMASLKRFPVVIGKDRYQAGRLAVQRFDPDVILLDDAFQHLRLKRDLDLLLMDYDNPLGNKRLLPAGRLREPFQQAADRADVVIFTRSQRQASKAAEKVIQSIKAIPWFKSVHTPFLSEIRPVDSSSDIKESRLAELKGKKAVLFSGLATNAFFFKTLSQSGIIILDHLEFKDHYRYKKADILKINDTARQKGAHIILTTQKDWVKIDTNCTWAADVGIIGVEIQFESDDAFRSLVKVRCLDS